ncbi:MAG: inositol monophosphatase [Thermomicrobiales bacterium]|nr:inositol monophosphatase [Thermomicrobiales bacterium]MCO5224381.1 inositol monophosphatase [Thermomicrobiales bacterium]MCO5228253.1 inositol monophosphatase [Thermomicrobiales bacterium]
MTDYAAVHDLMTSLAREAGDYAVAKLREGIVSQQKGQGIDVVTEVDVACERRMIERIRSQFPDHGITGEEHGVVCNPDASLQWLIDPLDGTNNYVLEMPMFGNCITVLEDGEPVVAAVHDSVSIITTSAYRGGGAWRNGIPTRVGSFPDLARTTISWTQGYVVTMDDPWVGRVVYDLQQSFKRVLGTWSPSIDWGLIAAGRVGAFAAWKNELHDLLCGELIVSEAGGEIWKNDSGDLVIAGAPEVVAKIREVIGV